MILATENYSNYGSFFRQQENIYSILKLKYVLIQSVLFCYNNEMCTKREKNPILLWPLMISECKISAWKCSIVRSLNRIGKIFVKEDLSENWPRNCEWKPENILLLWIDELNVKRWCANLWWTPSIQAVIRGRKERDYWLSFVKIPINSSSNNSIKKIIEKQSDRKLKISR